MRKKTALVAVVLVAVVMAVPCSVLAQAARDTVQTEVNKIVTTIQTPGFKDQPRGKQISDIRQIINAIFDYSELSKRTLGRQWKKFSSAQKEEFMALFSELLENTYADRILAYTDEKINFGDEAALKKNRVEVKSTILTKDNKSVPLNYRMIRKNGTWRVYDVVIEGISLVQNYRSQFREILATKSPQDLIDTLKQKVKKQ
jgi:phospholipid transport system substrate-binding protein